MLDVWSCVTQQHDLRLVALALILCLFACATAMSLVARARAARSHVQAGWLLGAGLVGGCGIWGTHFVAMLAFRSGFPVAFDPVLTLMSIVIAVCLCAAGFTIALSRPGPLAGGVVTGAAIVAMHYVGMAAVRAPATAVWNQHYVVASALMGMTAMAFGMWITLRGKGWRSRAASTVIFTLAICGMHFTGMAAVHYHFDPRLVVTGMVVEPTTLAIAVAAVAILIVALGLIVSLVDSHLSQRAQNEAVRLRAHIVQLEEAQEQLKHTGEDLRLAMTAAAAASEAKSAFLAAMSHELRTPLNAIIGFSETLSSETFGPLGDPRNAEYVMDIHSSGKHLLALINDVLDIVRIDAGKDQLTETIVGLEGLIDDTLRMLAPQAQAGDIRLSHEIAPDAQLLRGDERRLRQVLINLVGNAVKFTLAGGVVDVRAFCDDTGLVLAVRDSGIGMAAEDIPLALERFRQIDSSLARKYEGTGLGLPLARQLVELHGGNLAIESQPGTGTIVTVTLPAGRIVDAAAVAAA